MIKLIKSDSKCKIPWVNYVRKSARNNCYKFTLQSLLKANYLAHIDPRWYGSRISADCQQNLLSPKHDTGGRFLLVNFLKEQKREDNTQRDNLLAGKWQRLRWNKEFVSWDKSELKFEHNFTCFSWLLDFISSTVIQDE